MAKLIMYLVESSAVLAFFYLIYILILRRETFFSLNRFFLIGILVFSLLLPLVSFDFNPEKVVAVERPMDEISKFRMSYYEAMALWEFNAYHTTKVPIEKTTAESSAVASNPDWIKFSFITLIVLYAIGIIVCLSRTVWTLRWIRRMTVIYPQKEMDGVKVIKIPNRIAPFSFLNFVFVHDELVDTPEFDQILVHERAHIQQYHSIDLIFVQLLAAIFWFNPIIWRLIKSLKTTHEYIADKKIISSGYSLVEYQTLLLKQLISNNSYGLVHNFNLSFIKKRITMMQNKKSGWSGKVKVAMAITGTVIISAILIQCNSRFEESFTIESPDNKFTAGINLPVLAETGYKFKGDSSDVLNFTIAGNKLTINGKRYEVNEIISVIEKGSLPSVSGHIVMRIDKDQTMGFVQKVDMELRKADRRKILYLGQTDTGAKAETSILLPPTPENAAKNGMPMQPDISAVEAEGKIDILKIDLANKGGSVNQQKVYDFVTSHMQKQSSDYVVSVLLHDELTYNDYLTNLVYIKEGFNQIYQERAQKMFGKDYYEIGKEEFNEVRKGVPMAISIAEPRNTSN